MTTEGALAPASQVHRAYATTRNVLAEVTPDYYWASDANPAELLELVSSFTVRDAASSLQNAGKTSCRHLTRGTATGLLR